MNFLGLGNISSELSDSDPERHQMLSSTSSSSPSITDFCCLQSFFDGRSFAHVDLSTESAGNSGFRGLEGPSAILKMGWSVKMLVLVRSEFSGARRICFRR